MKTVTTTTELPWQQNYHYNSYHDNRITMTTVTIATVTTATNILFQKPPSSHSQDDLSCCYTLLPFCAREACAPALRVKGDATCINYNDNSYHDNKITMTTELPLQQLPLQQNYHDNSYHCNSYHSYNCTISEASQFPLSR